MMKSSFNQSTIARSTCSAMINIIRPTRFLMIAFCVAVTSSCDGGGAVGITLDVTQARPGATVTIYGDGFAPEIADNKVAFNGSEAQILSLEYSSDAPDNMTVKVPFTA